LCIFEIKSNEDVVKQHKGCLYWWVNGALWWVQDQSRKMN